MGGMRCMRYGRDDEHERAEAWGRPSHPSHRIFYYYSCVDNPVKQRLTKGIPHGVRRRVNSGSKYIIIIIHSLPLLTRRHPP